MASLKLWRLCRERYVKAAHTGEGAAVVGGRWNPVGVPVVYASRSLSLAVVEVFVHLTGQGTPEDYVSVEIDTGVEDGKAERVDVAKLPPDWRALDHPELQAIGARWARSKRSLVLEVPSAVIEGEWNALINPLHPDAERVRYGAAKPFRFDERMFR